MAGQKSHIETCEELMLTYKPFFEKRKVIFSQMQNGQFAMIVSLSPGHRHQCTFGTYNVMIEFLYQVVESEL